MLGNPPEAAHFEAVKRFWRISAEPRFIRAVENFVYTVDLDGTEWVLRLTCANRRSIDELASELDWIQFLSANGLSVAYPLPSLRGNLVERLSGGGGDYYAAVFRKLRTLAPPTYRFLRYGCGSLGSVYWARPCLDTEILRPQLDKKPG